MVNLTPLYVALLEQNPHKMEITLESIISIISLLIGGGSLGGLLVWRYTRRKAKAEAENAEVDTVKNMQEAYDKMFGQVNHNTHSIGISYVGGVAKDGKTPKDTRTDEQKCTMLSLLLDLRQMYPNAKIYGHRDFANKACPSFDAKKEYSRI